MANMAHLHKDNGINRDEIHIGDEEAHKYVTEVIDNCVWRRAIPVDGTMYWATPNSGEIGEPIEDGDYKVRHFGDYALLALKDEEHPDAEEIRK